MPGLWSGKLEEPTQTTLWNGTSGSAQENGKPSNGSNTLSPGSGSAVRRLSSATASLDDLSLGPSVVVPPERVHQPSDAHETAAALELAKHRLSVAAEDNTTPPETPIDTSTTDTYAFAFDIDGVLIRGGRPLPEAIEAMKVLNGQNEYGVKVYVLYSLYQDTLLIMYQSIHIPDERWGQD